MAKNQMNDIPDLDLSQADEMLAEILEQCHMEPNSVTLEELVSYSKYRKERYIFQKVVIGIVLLLFILIPMLFVSPKFTITQSTQADNTYIVSIDNKMPVSRVTARIGDHNLPVYEQSATSFTIEPIANGDMYVTVTLKNGQTVTKTETVDTVDVTAPKVVKNASDENYLYLYLSDDETGVDYAEVYAETENGDTITPSFYDEEEGYVAFTYPTETLNIFIPDKSENVLHLLLTLKE